MRGHNYSRAEHDDLAPAMELVRPAREWWTDPKQIARLGRWLDEQGEFRTPEDRWYFLEKVESRHESWSSHFDAMVNEEREQERERLYEEDRALESEGRYAP